MDSYCIDSVNRRRLHDSDFQVLAGMHSQNLLGCIFFIVVAVTDALDGFIARRYGMGTTLGAFLDPVADKFMVSAALIVLLGSTRVGYAGSAGNYRKRNYRFSSA